MLKFTSKERHRQDSIVNESPESRDKLKEANSKDTNVSVNNNIDTKDISDNDKLFNHNILVFSSFSASAASIHAATR